MRLKSLIVGLALLILTTCDNILVILDNALLRSTHSQFLSLLQASHNT